MIDGSAQQQGGRPSASRRRLRSGLLLAIGLLYLVSVPWYRSEEAAPATWLGLPDWVAVAIVCYAAAAVLNALAWWWTDVDDHAPLPPVLAERPDRGARERDA